MKKINLIEWLSRNSHEKQSPQRFARYAAMLIMLLTLGVGQMWGAWYVVGDNMPYGWSNVTENKMSTSGSTETAYLSLAAGLNYDFKLYGGSWDGGSTRKSNGSDNVSLDTDYQTYNNNSDSNGKMRFSPSVTGVYKFVLNTSTNKLRISYEKPSAAAPSAVVSGTNVMFYIQSHSGIELAVNKGTSGTSNCINATSIGDARAYVNITTSQRSTYYYITNNRTGWAGDSNSGIKTATGGELFVTSGSGNTSATTASTSASVTGDVLSISTTTGSTSGVLSGSLYIQYYIDGSFAGVTYSASTASYGDIPAGGATARASTYNVSGLSNGSHTLKTVLTDGIIYYVADQDNFNVAHTYSVTLDDDGDYQGNGSATIKYHDKALTVSSHASRTSWNLVGYWNSSAAQVTDASGNLLANVTSYTNSDGEWIYEDDVTLYAHWSKSYSVTYNANGGTGTTTDASSPYAPGTDVTVLSNSFTLTGYSFTGWNTENDGTGTPYAAGSTIENIDENVTLYAQWSENKSTVSVVASPTGAGTFSSTSVSAGVDTKPTVTATAQPGYKFASWGITGGANMSGSTDNPVTITGKDAGAAATLTASFDRTYAFVEGRFQVYDASRNTRTNTSLDNGGWNDSQCYIPFSYDNTNHRFELHTYSTPKELSDNIFNNAPVFYVKLSTASGSLSNVVSYWSATSQTLSAASTKKTLTHTGDLVNYNLKFSSSDESGYAILYFDEAGIWYELEQRLQYNGNGNTGGSAPSNNGNYFAKGTKAAAGTNAYTKTGYHFTGWKINNAGDLISAGSNVTMNSNITLYAQWEPDTYTNVTLNATTGSTNGAYSVTYNANILTVTTEPAKTGYEPEGYYKTYSAGAWSTLVATPAGALQPSTGYTNSSSQWATTSGQTLYTKWQAKTYPITLHDNNGGSNNGSAKATYNSGSLTNISAPKKTGYHVDGYYKEAGLSNLISTAAGVLQASTAYTNSDGNWTNDGTETLYAKWAENQWSVAFTNDGNGTVTTPNSTPQTVGEVTGISIEATPAFGYRFSTWTTASGTGSYTSGATTNSNTFKPTSAATVRADFTRMYAFIEGRFAVRNSTRDVVTKTHATDWGDDCTAIPMSYDGTNRRFYVHTYSTPAELAESVNSKDPYFYVRTSTSDASISGGDKYCATGSGSSQNLSAYGTSNKKATTTASTANSFNFTGSEDGYVIIYFDGTNVWYELECALSYNSNSGTGSAPASRTYYAYGSSQTAASSNPYTFSGYTFSGWNTANDGSGTDYALSASTVAMNTKEVVLYPKWTQNITLNQNSATSEGTTSIGVTYNSATIGAISNPSRTGYTFAGWTNGSGGSGTLTINTSGVIQANVSSWTGAGGVWTHAGASTVYAKWTPNNYAVTLSTTGETGYGSGAPVDQTATYDADMPTITPPVGAPGYKFMGYFTEANGAGTQYYNADGTSAHTWDIASASTLHAHFQKTVISTLEHPASIAKGDVVTLDVNPVLNQTGATNYMDICWSLLYDNDNPVESGVAVASYTEGGTKQNQVRFTLTGLSAGYYKVKAVLKANASSFVACDAGTELSTFKSNVRIAGNSNVTILYQDASGNTIHENGSVEVARGETVEVTAPEIIGYEFSTWVLGDVLATDDELTDNPITISAEYDGHLTAKYNRKNTIYFKNTLNWPAVYVNLLTEAYWASDGTGNNGKSNRNLAMTQIGTSDVWYYEYDNKSTSHYVSFTSVEQNGTGYGAEKFWGADADENKVCVVYPTRPNHDANERTAYGFNVNTPMFVPLAGQEAVEMNVTVTPTPGRAYYYNKGYWAKYEPVSKETGYTLKIFNKKNNADEPDAGNAPVLVKSVPFVFDGDMTFPVSVTVDLEAGKWYGFKLYRDKGNSSDPLSWYGNSGNMSNKHSGDFSKSELVWEFKTTLTANCGLKTNSAGDYVFTLAYGKEASKDSMQYLIGVHYPEAAGDYRLVYSDNNRTGILSTTIPFESEADTLSFFVDKTASPKLALQKCAIEYKDETSTVTWTDTIADLFSGGLPSAIKESGVYYFCINKDPKTGKKVFGDTKLYEGNFYIRTDGATPSKWDNFRQNNHLMAYSDYADLHENFTHSYTQWYDITNRKNLKFTVANDYSVSISDTLVREALEGQWAHINDYIDEKGDLNRQANVRFMYNSKTNAISRAYIDGAYEAGGNFLKILARTQDSIYAAAEGGNPLTEITFTDNGNWLYEQTVFAQPGARYKLRSLFGTTDGGKQVITQYFKGGVGSTAADSATMIGGDGSSRMQIRLLYDFKTNRVVTAYQPSGTIDENLAIHADIMFMREHQGDIEQITFAEGKSISEIENIYCGLRFNKWTLNNKSKEDGHATLSPLLSRYERDIFYVSFPYDVRLSDVIGFGTYGQHWIIEYYDGAARAKNGFWIDSDSYWKFVTPSMKDTFTLKAGTGYIVALDLDELYYISEEVHASIWNNTDISDLELLFPGNVSSISNVDVTYNMPSHECKINRGTTAGNRTIKDSHWNVLGVPTFKNITGAASADGGGSGEIRFANVALLDTLVNDLKFIYDGNLADNSLTPKAVKDFEFKAMHAYVVQYCGDVTFTTSATPAPASVAARTYAEAPQEVDFRLELNKDGVVEDQTFVSLSNAENASADFRFGEDMSKEFNSNRANIYTFIGTEWVAGNTLPMTNQTTIVPVGVKIAADGEYTFSIPEGTYGVGITLIDNEAGARVNLGLMDYTVTLAAGQIDDRFVLEISPISQISTDVEAVTGDGLQVTGARKIMIDGLLYIVKDGVVYDAQGRRL